MRTSPVHYIDPSAISIVPNCNGSANDVAVTISRGVKIKVYCPRAGIDKVKETGEYQEWILTGRNRRLADSTKPYTIYARLPKSDKTKGYVVFSPMTPYPDDVWVEKHLYLDPNTPDGFADLEGVFVQDDNWWVKLGDVSLPDANNQRTVTLDTGILGTEQFNDEWALRPDELPLRIELGCTINDEDAGPTPYVHWGQSLVLTAMLTEGWTGTDIQRFDHWEIMRNSGDGDADNAWNYQQTAGQDTLTPRQMPDGQITLQHIFGGTDDFNGAVAVTFTILAVGHNADTLQREILKTATINIMAETVATYELEQSSAAVTYNPLDNTYSPTSGVSFRIRAKAQDGSVSFADDSHIALAQLRLYALPEGEAAESRTRLTFTGGTATLPVTAFAGGKSINLWLENGAQEVLARTTVAYIRYGEKGDTPISIYRWYKVGLTPLKPTSTSSEEPAPAAGDATGAANVYPTDKWSRTAPDRPATGEWALWMCGSILHGSGIIDAWSTPVRISATDGAAGEDGSDREYIYIRTNTFPFSGTLPANISTGEISPQGIAAGSETDKTQDDWVPNGWSDTALPADNSDRYVYMSVREKPAGINQQWGPFGNPVLWSNWGVRGTDGDGVEHVFIRTQNNVAPVMDSIQAGYTADEFRPTITAASQTASLTEQAQTTDDPKGPNSTYPYEWVATRGKGDAASDGTRQWTKYTGKNNDYAMSLWSRWADDGVPPEQIYIHTSSYPYNGSTPASVDADGNVPSGWSATPVGVSQQYPYEYRSVRRKINGHWGAWSTPQLDAKWSSDGTSISIKGGADMVIGWNESLPSTDDDGFRCLMNNNDGDDMEVYEIDDWQQLTGSWQGYSADVGDIYLVDGDMWMKQNNTATASSPRWKNLGRIQGPAGNDGKDAVRIDLDNQADIIACREDGTVRFTRIITIHARIYDGASVASTGVSTPQTAADMAIAGVTPSVFTLVDGMLTVTWQFLAGTTITPGSYTKDIKLSYGGETYTAQLSVTSSNTSAVYQLRPNMSEASFQVDANGSYTPATQNVYCGYTKTDGGGTLTFPGNNIANLWREGGAPYNIFWRLQKSDGTFTAWSWAKDLPDGVLSVSNTTTHIGIEFAMSAVNSVGQLNDTNIIDRELIAIVKGGKDGADNERLWLLASTETIKVSDTGTTSPVNFFVKLMRTKGNETNELTAMPYNTAIEVYKDGLEIISFNDVSDANGWFDKFRSGTLTTADFANANAFEFRLRARLQTTVYGSVSIVTVHDGTTGSTGKTGRFFYYAKEYDGNPSHYKMEATQAPYVKVDNAFYMLDNQGVEPDSLPWSPTTAPGAEGDKAWTRMTSEQQYYIARAFFGENAYLGSFVVNGDWIISQYGTLYDSDGTSYTIDDTGTGKGFSKDDAYTVFNPDYPVTSDPDSVNFCPNFAVDGKTGKTYQNNAYIRGEIYAKNGEFQGTVRATNFFNKICYFYDGGTCIGGDGTHTKGGLSYAKAGMADIIMMMPRTTSADWTGTLNDGTVLLPDPASCDGKMVTVFCHAETASGTPAIGCVASNKFVTSWSLGNKGLTPGGPTSDTLTLGHAFMLQTFKYSSGTSGSIVHDSYRWQPSRVVLVAQNGYWFKLE